MNQKIELHALQGIPEIEPNQDLVAVLADALRHCPLGTADGDVFVIAQKIVSKAENKYLRLADISPSPKALDLAARVHKDPRKVQAILDESRRVVRAEPPRSAQSEGILITEHRLGFICANAAIDQSNIDRADSLLLLPTDPDASARQIQKGIADQLGVQVGIVISDTFGRPWRRGLVNVAIGSAGIPVLQDLTDSHDAYGRALRVTVPAFADEIAAASGLLMAKDGGTPVIQFRGLDWQPDPASTAQTLIRPEKEDLFR